MAKRPHSVGRPKSGSLPVEAEAAILNAALDLFAAKNFSSVRTVDIAKATGFNQALIFYYFDNKEELYRRALQLAIQQAFESFRLSRAAAEDPAGLIFAWIDTHIRAYDSIAKLIKLSIDYVSTAERKASIDRAIRTFYDDEREVLLSALESGVASGAFAKIDASQTATFISTYLDGVFVRAMILSDFKPVPAIRGLKTYMKEHLTPPPSRR
ncbi:MAG: TetR/AcrR family transcriptional regulator [Hyphomicrobium sp.]|nr:TetR/AcrR family transcriptional regulator [Hyphomicrobium sp.]PPD06068.1 MAG: TetR family transcriptional regulator [Hyphomicrobium sp.]